MKNTKIFSFIIILVISITSKIYATNTEMVLIGEQLVKAGEEYTLTLNIKSDEAIGLVSGDIDYSDNIELIEVKTRDGWNLTYNQENGMFNTYNALGEKQADVLNVRIKVKHNKGKKAIVEIKDCQYTTIKYESNAINTITKEMKVQRKNNTINIVIILVVIILCIIFIKKRKHKNKKV